MDANDDFENTQYIYRHNSAKFARHNAIRDFAHVLGCPTYDIPINIWAGVYRLLKLLK